MGPKTPYGSRPAGERRPVKMAVVGVGYWGPNFVRTLDELPEAELLLVCDTDQERAAFLRRQYPDVRYVTSVDEVWRDPEVEAVVLSTNSATHYSLGMEGLEAGKHMLVEKPLALSVEEGETITRAAEERGRVLLVGHLLRYHAGVRQLREYIDRGELGDLLYIYSTRVNLGKIRLDESALWSLAPHDISVVLYLVDEMPREVRAVGECYVTPGIHDLAFVHLSFPGKVMSHIHVSWLDPHKVRKFTVVGKEKMAVLDDTELREKVRVYDKGVNFSPTYGDYAESLTVRVGDILIPRLEMVEPLKLECRHFIACVRGEEKPLTGGESGVAVLRILEAAEESLRLGGRAVPVQGL